MRKSLTFLACALALAGCMNSTQQTPPALQSVEYTCASATAALNVVNTFFAKLSEATIAAVARAKAITDPICLQEAIPTLDSTAKLALDGALRELTAASQEAAR